MCVFLFVGVDRYLPGCMPKQVCRRTCVHTYLFAVLHFQKHGCMSRSVSLSCRGLNSKPQTFCGGSGLLQARNHTSAHSPVFTYVAVPRYGAM